MLYKEDPKDSTRKLLELMNEFGRVVKYKINTQKSPAFLYTNNNLSENEIKKTIPFIIASRLPRWLSSKESTCRRCKRHGFNPWVRKIPWRRKCQPTLAFLPGKPLGQRSLAGYSP